MSNSSSPTLIASEALPQPIGQVAAILSLIFGLLSSMGLMIDLTRIESETRHVTHQMAKPDAEMRIAEQIDVGLTVDAIVNFIG